MITTNWRTETVPLADRADALRQTIREHVVPVELVLPSAAEQVHADVTITDIGSLQVSTVRANPATVHRTSRLARADDEPVLFISLQVSGESTVVQDGRSAVLRPGSIAFYDTRRPYTLLFDHGVDMHFFRIPVRDVALPDDVLCQAVARGMGQDGGVPALATGYLRRLAESRATLDATAAHLLAAPSMELVRAVIASESDRPASARGPLYEALGVRILEHMRTHLADPDLSPASVARAHHISVRYLYTILARAGVGFGEWVRTERLDACRRELSRVPPTTETIAALAHRWGFRSPSHFSRAFKAAYGVSPQAWRDLRHPS
ncbi:helix-turn-helix domain-containing protein [Streptomyces sp. NPDC002619]|uniref:AraC-like ligand-binding domain-containing protein n=1 Tax=Streptomyces sp. NPDC002619 TaxID=3364655 RepID=UPI0036CB328A